MGRKRTAEDPALVKRRRCRPTSVEECSELLLSKARLRKDELDFYELVVELKPPEAEKFLEVFHRKGKRIRKLSALEMISFSRFLCGPRQLDQTKLTEALSSAFVDKVSDLVSGNPETKK